jgi:hypothetical protein
MENCKPIMTPMGAATSLDLDEDGEPIDQKVYRSMIGSLLYHTASRPDIQFSVCLCARFQASPVLHIYKLSNAFSGIYVVLKTLAYGFLLPHILA